MPASRTPVRARLSVARLYFVTDARWADPAALGEVLRSGVDLVQLRDKQASDDELLGAARVFREAAHAHGALFVLNDRADLAAAASADGVHVGQEDAPVKEVRRELGEGPIVGLSTHSPAQLEAGLATGADYLSVGPVWETPTKPGRAATGLEYVRHAAGRAGERPWFAIGGIDRSNIAQVLDAGARRVVVARAIAEAHDPRAAATELREALERRTVGAAQ